MCFFSTASVWADHVRSSVMWTPRNLKPFTRSTGVLSMVMGVCSLLCVLNPPPAPWSYDVEWEVILLTTIYSGYSPPLCRPSHRCRWSGLSPLCRQQIWRWRWSYLWLYSHVCTGSTEWAEDAALRSTSVEDQGRWGIVVHSDHLNLACQEVHDPAAQRSVQSQSLELRNQCGRHYGVKCWAVVHEQHSHIGVLIFQVGESSVQGEGNSIVCGTVTAVCKL